MNVFEIVMQKINIKKYFKNNVLYELHELFLTKKENNFISLKTIIKKINLQRYFSNKVLRELNNYLNNKKYFSNSVINELKLTKIIQGNSSHAFFNQKIHYIINYQLNICDLDYFIDYKNNHIIHKYKCNYREINSYYSSRKNKYIVNLLNNTCSCMSYKYSSKNNKHFKCKHLKPIIEKIEKQYTKMKFILILKQYTSISQAIDLCCECL